MSKANRRQGHSSNLKSSLPRSDRMDFDLPQFMQPLSRKVPPNEPQLRRRPKWEIVRELRHLRAQGSSDDNDADDKMATLGILGTLTTSGQPVQTLDQLDALRLTRHRIEQLLHSSSRFDQAVQSCFVRVNINGANVPPEHRMAQIFNVAELPLGYYVGKTATNIVLHLRYENLCVSHELNDISNMAFTREEFDFWHDNCICQGIDWPTMELVARKKIELYNAFNSELKIGSMLRQKALLGFSMPMRPVPKGELLQRLGGGVYPWKLQRPAKEGEEAAAAAAAGAQTDKLEQGEHP
ncbi:GH12472 [Drosophila grimshawi]|uniref:GH12472 n=2 Tax=Drosophila grimshawi TaxID=7222 RepID=B4JJE4_DROGR|nr:GH12472 [Drosophila grimshawi]